METFRGELVEGGGGTLFTQEKKLLNFSLQLVSYIHTRYVHIELIINAISAAL
jgi:hypothetical protein